MRKLIVLEHMSLDGFLAGPNGEMDWIRGVDQDAMWEYVNPIALSADTAVFGRVTYGMMESYWPTAGDQPNASRHDIDHSQWLNGATKLLLSKTLSAAKWGDTGSARVVHDVAELRQIKQESGGDMLLIGSASVARECIALALADELRINVNPVILGGGTPLFPNVQTPTTLRLVASHNLPSGVVGLHYAA
jgi:dihydrofolate reductase